MISDEQVTKPSTSEPEQVKQPTVNWLDLPSDVMKNILSRLGMFDILENAQKVCTTWHQICKEPAMWRAVKMKYSHLWGQQRFQRICKHVVDRSQGQMVDVSISAFCDQDILQYIAARSSQLRRLEITYSYGILTEVWGGCLKKLSLLEELSVCGTQFSEKDIEAVGRFCPLLKTLKVKNTPFIYNLSDDADYGWNTWALAIGKNLPGLRYLQLTGFTMTGVGLRAILDGCRHLESLKLGRCNYIDLNGDLVNRCSQQIKHLKLPRGYKDSFGNCDSD
uniref:putative F-box/LRR-repeat protein 23 n=1 Tax=Erigeron canadensis TaxID=72917 RepID=UPI001CB9831B|nr:putative F-box/LRR-repeat protein 23 [Erigeron canadensis]XP_043629088.1 putative F-box/LRR-repeat protein 23 [Erigeron canadensis]